MERSVGIIEPPSNGGAGNRSSPFLLCSTMINGRICFLANIPLLINITMRRRIYKMHNTLLPSAYLFDNAFMKTYSASSLRFLFNDPNAKYNMIKAKNNTRIIMQECNVGSNTWYRFDNQSTLFDNRSIRRLIIRRKYRKWKKKQREMDDNRLRGDNTLLYYRERQALTVYLSKYKVYIYVGRILEDSARPHHLETGTMRKKNEMRIERERMEERWERNE